MRSGPGTGAASTVSWWETRLPCRHPSSNHNEGCALNLTPGLRFYDGPMTLMTGVSALESPAIPLGRPPLSLPVADSAGLAGPDLDAGIEGLGIERIVRVTGNLRTRHQTRLGTSVRDAGAPSNPLGRGFRFGDHLRTVALAIDSHVERTRREAGGGAERFGRKHRRGEVEAEKFVGSVFVAGSQAAPDKGRRAQACDQNIFWDHQ